MSDGNSKKGLKNFGIYAAAAGASIIYTLIHMHNSDDQSYDPNTYNNDKKPKAVVIIPPENTTKATDTSTPIKDNIENTTEQKSPQIIFPVFFEGEKSTLSEKEKNTLQNMAEYLKATGSKFEIKGCATPYEEEKSGAILSYSRAHHVAELLKEHGINVIINKASVQDWEKAQNNDIYGMYSKECEIYDNKVSTQRRVEIISDNTPYNYE